jgi:acetyl esterase/lipase
MEEENLTTFQKAALRDKEAQKLLRESKTLGHKMRLPSNPALCSLYYPGKKALVIDLHGGGFCFKSVLDNDIYCDYISKTFGLAVLNAAFTLSYQAPYPQQMVDITAELLSLLQKQNELVGLPLIFVGHSSGADLAAGLVIRLKEQMKISGLLLNYPFLDLQRDQSTRMELPDTFPTWLLNDWIHLYCPYPELLSRGDVSPTGLTVDDLRDFPPTFITVATQDRLQEDGRSFSKLLSEGGIPNQLLEVEERHGFIERHMPFVYTNPADPAVISAKKVTDASFDWLLKSL